MKLYYTAIRNDISSFLIEQAKQAANEGKRVFYIAPNSLSFEKERAVLQGLDREATFDIMVTRFEQMARYLTLNQGEHARPLDDLGLSMLLFRVLSQFQEEELKVYGKLKQDMHFIQQVLDLYKELQTSNIRIEELEWLDSGEKKTDLIRILSAFEANLQQGALTAGSKLTSFRKVVESGQLDQELQSVTLVVDGFTRFSAEEEALITALNGRVADIHIGVYASQKAYRSSYIEGNLYQASVEFLRHLAQRFQTKPVYVGSEQVRDALGAISSKIESYYDFSAQEKLLEEETAALTIWQATNQKEEIEALARSIRQQLYEGVRYKDIVVLLGDVEGYRLQLGTLFDKYDIPYYLGQAEEMSHHPLVHVIESLERIKRYNFRREDVLNLLKTGLYGELSQGELDYFEHYLVFADIQGRTKFSKDFSVNHRERYDLEALNRTRQAVLPPLLDFLKAQPQSGTSLLQKFLTFIESIQLRDNLAQLAAQFDEKQQEKEEQVWKSFCHILEEMQEIVGHEKLHVTDFLTLLRSGMQASQYRTVPATVDVVNVKGYDLIAPHTAKYVYAIGLSQSHFPKTSPTKSLLTDDEKGAINAHLGEEAHFYLPSQEQLKKNHFVFLSLINAATEHLVLSSPQLYHETEESLSPYLKLLIEMGIPVQEKGRKQALHQQEDLVHYKHLLSRIIEWNRLEFDQEWDRQERTFWSVAIRYLRKKMEQAHLSLPPLSHQPVSQPLSKETLACLYPLEKPVVLSASSLTDFYQNEYLYFIKHVLGLQEQESIHPDARSHGNFLHRIFERVSMDQEAIPFDEKLTRAIALTRQEKPFVAFYGEEASSQFSEEILIDIARSTSLVFREESPVRVLANEAVFGKGEGHLLPLAEGHQLKITGKIDRIDMLEAQPALGIVDYKSGPQTFKIDRFYHGLSPQLVTYIAAVKELSDGQSTDTVFGAMYLHMLDPIVRLTDTKQSGQVLAEAYKSLVYKGLFMEEESHLLNHFYQKTKSSLYSQEELATLLAYNQHLYQEAGNRIVNGQFAINPYTEDGKSVAGEQLKHVTGFEANLHLGQARHLVKGGKKEDWLQRMKETLSSSQSTEQERADK